jgi:hypothetical protein
MIASVPAVAPMTPPDTGASMSAAPRAGDLGRLSARGGGRVGPRSSRPRGRRAAVRRAALRPVRQRPNLPGRRDDGHDGTRLAGHRGGRTAPTWRPRASSGSAAAGTTSSDHQGVSLGEKPPGLGPPIFPSPMKPRGPPSLLPYTVASMPHRSSPRRPRRDVLGTTGATMTLAARDAAGPLLVGWMRLAVAWRPACSPPPGWQAPRQPPRPTFARGRTG